MIEELRLLEQTSMVGGGLPFTVNGPSLQDLLIEQANQSNNAAHENMIGRNRSAGSLRPHSQAPGDVFESLLLRVDHDASRLQAAASSSSSSSWRMPPEQNNSHLPPLINMRGISGIGMGSCSPKDPLLQAVDGGQQHHHHQGGLTSRLEQLSGSWRSAPNSHYKRRPLMMDRDALVGLLKRKRSSVRLGSGSSSQITTTTPALTLPGCSFTLPGCSFPLPSIKKARKMKGATLLSYRVLWANPNVRSPTTGRELFSRKVSQNRVEIVDNSTRLMLIS
jgi:hypothetical protein